jgi:hypothetical protein
MMRRKKIEVLACVLAVAAVCSAGSKDIRMVLQLDPELPVTGDESIYVGPILIEPRDDEAVEAMDLSAAREFEIYLRKILRREAELRLVPQRSDLQPPSRHLGALVDDSSFWIAMHEELNADLIVAASIDVKVLDRAGYTTEEYVSPQDGKTYFRQVLVEETGFSYDILLVVIEGATGDVIHEEQITDFKPENERKLEKSTDMFTDLYTLQNRIIGIFVPRQVQVKRTLFSD